MSTEIVNEVEGSERLTLSEVTNRLENMDFNLFSQTTKALMSLLRNYKRNEGMMNGINSQFQSFGNLTHDTFFDFMKKINDRLNAPFESFLRFFIKQEIILRHYKESFRKMNITGIATQKFVLEGGMIRFLGGVEVDHSSPRIDTLMAFAQDFGLIKGDCLTENGKNLLKELMG